MLKKTIAFKDLDGGPVIEDFYFNLTKAETMEIQFSHKGGLGEHAEKIIAAKDMGQLIALFKELIVKSVGRRSEDGRRFIKNQEVIDDFLQTEAYSELFMELSTNTDSAIEFMTGIVPAEMKDSIQKGVSTTDVELPNSEEPAWLQEGRTPTPIEVRDATPEQLRMAFQRKQAEQPTA